MENKIKLKTKRLVLRPWLKSDYKSFAELNADPVVMEYYPSTLNEKESDNMADKLKGLISEQGWGLWAVETKNEKKFIGFVGLHKPTYNLPVSPCVEIGWRLAKEYWGNGYATEAAEESLRYAFEELGLGEVYSFTPVLNSRSRSVMERLNMSDTKNNFEHAIIPEGHPLREHLLYIISKEQWDNHAVNRHTDIKT